MVSFNDVIRVDIYERNYDVFLLSNSEEHQKIKYGYEVFQYTPKYLGPDNENTDAAYTGNNLSCNNCHLWAGTKPYAAPLIGVIQRFPQFRGRENKIGTIEERINGGMERSMNGKMIPTVNKEMKAMVAYLTWLSRFAPEDGKVKGRGLVKLKIPDRAVHLENGEAAFNAYCVVCHGNDGQGKRLVKDGTYEYPPLWGNDSYNDGGE